MRDLGDELKFQPVCFPNTQTDSPSRLWSRDSLTHDKASRPSRFEPLWQQEIHLLPIVVFQRQLHDCERSQVDSREATLNKAPFSTSKKTLLLWFASVGCVILYFLPVCLCYHCGPEVAGSVGGIDGVESDESSHS